MSGGSSSIRDSAGNNRLIFEDVALTDIRAKRTQTGADKIITVNYGSDGEIVQLDAGSTIATVELADDSSLSIADFMARVEERGGTSACDGIEETNTSTGGAHRPKPRIPHQIPTTYRALRMGVR